MAARQVNRPRPGERVRAIELQRAQAGGAQVLVQHAGLRIADDIARTGHRIRRHRQPAGHGLQQHQAEGIGLAREHEHVGGGIDLREFFAV